MVQLTDEQEKVIKEAVDWFRHSSKQTFELSGSAGTGKSLVLHCIVNELGLSELEIAPAAYTGAAAIVMRRNNFPTACTIHSLLYSYKEVLNRSTGEIMRKFEYKGVGGFVKLIIIDEAGMCDINIRRDLEKTHAKIIVAGDINQLPPISGQPAYFQNPSEIHYLTKIMRQNAQSAIVYLSQELLHHKRILPGTYGDVMVITKSDFYNNLRALIREYGIVLCGLNKTRDHLNTLIRTDILGYKNPLPNIGERLINRKNLWELQIDNGIALVNGTVGKCLTTVDISKYNKDTFIIDFKPDFTEEAFTNLEVDYKYFLADYSTRKIINTKYNPSSSAAKMEYAYACTTHVAQGSQFDSGIYIQEYFPHNSHNLHYTGLTRFKQKALYVVPDLRKPYNIPIFKCESFPVSKVY